MVVQGIDLGLRYALPVLVLAIFGLMLMAYRAVPPRRTLSVLTRENIPTGDNGADQ